MIDPQVYRLLSYGMYVVASFRQGKLNGQLATAVFQVTAEPPQLAVCLNCQNLTHELVKESRKFSVSILSTEAPLKFIGLFGFKCGRNVDKYSGLKHSVLASGTPVISDYSLGWLDLEVTQSVELGTHTMFIGRVVESGTIPPGEAFDPAQAKPMTYAYYHAVKGGKTQANAPTYLKE
jgi:ferric-chelate reductase [NAD(P)H]